MDPRFKSLVDQVVNEVQQERQQQAPSWMKAGADAAQQAYSQQQDPEQSTENPATPTDQLASSQGVNALSALGGIASQGIEKLGYLMRGEADPSFVGAVQQTERDISTQQPNQDPGLHQKSVAALAAVPVGAVKAGYEVRDAVLGEQSQADKSPLRRQVEAMSGDIRDTSAVGGAVEGISQFVTGMIGAGKLLSPVKTLAKIEEGGKLARAGYETVRGGIAGFFALDPHEERLSNIIQSFPALANPVNEYLAAKPEDGAAEGRFKNALEGMGVDVIVTGLFGAALKAVRYARSGDQQAAKEAVKELDTPETVKAVQELEKPKVQVPGGSQSSASPIPDVTPAAGADVPATGEKPRVRVKAGSEARAAALTESTPPSVSQGMPPVQKSGPELPEDVATTATPVLAPKIATDIPDDTMATILRGTQWDLAAMEQAGSMEEAISQGYRAANAGSLPWQKISTPEEADILISNAAKTLKPELDAIKGGDVLSDGELGAQVRRMASYFNDDPSVVLGDIAKAGEASVSMVRDMEAAYLVSNKMFLDTSDLVTTIRAGNLEKFGGDRAAAVLEAKRRLGLAVQTYGSAQAIRSSAGRTMRRLRSEFRVDPQQLDSLRGLDDDQFLRAVSEARGDPAKLRDLAKPGILKRLVNEAQFSLTNSLLWLWPSHAVNLTTNALLLSVRPAEKWLGSLAMGSAGSVIRQQAQKEFGYTASAIGDGLRAALDAFKAGDSILQPHYASEFIGAGHIQQNALSFKRMDSLEGIIHNALTVANYRNIVGLPTRALGAVDELMKTLRYRAVVQSKAAVDASRQGLEGDTYRAYVADALAKSFDAEGRAVDASALREAQTATFQQDLERGTIGAWMQNGKAAHPALGFVVPFVKTPINVLRYSHKMTPGLNLLQKEYREMLLGTRGAEQQAHAIGQMALGSLFMMFAAKMAAQGNLTGGGPTDPELLKELKASGWQPYSIVWEDGAGKRHYFPLGRFDPVGLPVSIVADIVEGRKYYADQSLDAAATATLLGIARSFEDRTFVFNVESFLRTVSEPDKYAGKWAGQTAANTVPLSSLLRGVNPDPYMREARSLTDYIRKDIPGLSASLPPRRDAFGEPIARRVGLLSSQEADVVEAESMRLMLEAGGGITPPNPVQGGVDLRDFTLSDGRNAYDRFQELAAKPVPNMPHVKETLARLIESKEYQHMEDGDAGTKTTKINALAGVVQDYRQAAFRQMLADYPELYRETRAKEAEAAAKYLDNSTGSSDAGDRLRKALGMDLQH